MDWNYNCIDLESGKKKFYGDYYYNGCKFHFSGTTLEKGKGLAKITISLIDPTSGFVLQIQGPRRRDIMSKLSQKELEKIEKGRRLQKLNAETEIYPTSLHEKDIKAHIKKGAMRLYTQNYNTVQKLLEISAKSGSIRALGLYTAYQHKFFQNHACAENTLKDKQIALQTICAMLDGMPIGSITAKKLQIVYNSIGSKPTWKFHIAQDFFRYCSDHGAIHCQNPFDLYFATYDSNGNSTTDNARKSAEKAHCLEPSVEAHLYARAKESLSDSLSLVITLAVGARLSTEEIRALKWADILISQDNAGDRVVFIKNFKPDLTGGTHNYTRPPLPDAQRIILQKYDMLSHLYSVTKVQKMYLVHDPENPFVAAKTTAISNCIRQELLHSGLSVHKLSETAKKSSKTPGGAGLRILHEHYDHTLRTECGVDLHSGLYQYLRGLAITDTTTDYYRSLINKDGQHQLLGIVRRADHNSSKNTTPSVIANTTESSQQITVGKSGVGMLTTLAGRVIIPPGCTLSISSAYGVRADLSLVDTDSKT